MGRRERLRQLLQAHRPVDTVEASHCQSMLELLGQEHCFDRNSFEPGHFTASAFVLSPAGDSLVLILHAKLGLWLQPGGHVDPDDVDLLAAARREVQEEVGLDDLEWHHQGVFDVDVHRIPEGRDPAHRHFDVRFLFRARDMVIKPSSDALDARWIPLNAVAEVQSDESVMRAVRRLR